MPKIVEKVKFRKQFTSVVSGKLESIYWGYLAPSEAARSHEYIERLVASQRMNTVPDATIQKWLSDLSDKRYEKLVKVHLVKPRSRDTLGNFLERYIDQLGGSKNTLDNYIASKDCLIAFFGFDRKPETICCQEAMQYKEYLKTTGRIDGKGGYGQNSVRKKLIHANKFFRAMLKAEFIRENPFEEVRESPIDETDRKKYVSAGYCLKAMEYAPNEEWRLLIALWRFGGFRRACETLRLRWSDILWEKKLIHVYSSKTGEERHVPIFPEIMEPLLKVRELAASDAEWVIDLACPKKYRLNPTRREEESKNANLHTEFNRICQKAGLKVCPMAGNNMRASCIKDLYSGKYPELRGRIDLIAQIFGHSPATALKYYKRFSTDYLAPLTDSFNLEIPEPATDLECVKKCVAHEEKEANPAHLITSRPQENACFVASDATDDTTITPEYSFRGYFSNSMLNQEL
jgi:Site-specific recombinase XerC